MAARNGMSALITDVREKCEAGTADYTVNGVTYWTDDQIQKELDRCRMSIQREQLYPIPEYTNGTAEYYDYYWKKPDVEAYDSDNPEIFHLENANGTVVGTADYSINYEAKHIRFDSDTEAETYYLSYRSYNTDRVAARIWKKKAAHVAQRIDLKSDNHDIKGSQLRKQYLEMASFYAQSAGPNVVMMVRGDVN